MISITCIMAMKVPRLDRCQLDVYFAILRFPGNKEEEL